LAIIVKMNSSILPVNHSRSEWIYLYRNPAFARLFLLLTVASWVIPTQLVLAEPAVDIIAFGDSTTAPRRVNGRALKVWADVLAEDGLIRWRGDRIINAGIGGNNTVHARARFQRDVLRRQPGIVIIQFGINDSAVDVWKDPPPTDPRVALEDYRTNLNYFVKELNRRGCEVILMTPNPLRWTEKLKKLYGRPPYDANDVEGFNVLLKSYADALRETAQQTSTPLIDVDAAFRAYDAVQGQSMHDLLLDGMHPNAKGHRLVADLLREQLSAKENSRPSSKQPSVAMKPASNGVHIDSRVTELVGLPQGPFVRLDDRRLLTVQETYCLTSSDEGKSWKTNSVFGDSAKFNISRERAILKTSKGEIIVAFMNLAERHWTWSNKLGDAPGAMLPTYVMRSLDEGVTWEAPRKLHDDWTGAIRDILETKDGRVVFTSMKLRHDPGRHTVLTYSSGDQGRTWQASNVIDLGGAGHHGGVTEATIEELKNGRLYMLLRTNWERFWWAESTDGGLHWHPMGPTDIHASSAPGMLHRLASGRLILAWNRPLPEGKTSFQRQGGDRLWSATPVSNHRAELSIAFSEDEGQTWSKPDVIARKPRTSLAYPYIFEPEPGVIWLTTMQGGLRLKFREADLVR
jgi:lysophospholipase L1-like esterase